MDDVESRVRNLLKKTLYVEDISIDDDLVNFGLTSVSVIKLIMAIEAEFEFQFDDDDLSVNKIRTIRKIEDCINNNT